MGEIKKEMKGLAWSPYSKDKENIIVAGPVPGKTYSQMILPVLAPVPDGKEVNFGKFDVSAGGNRGRGQVYPNGNLSNNNVFTAPEAGVVKSIVAAEEVRAPWSPSPRRMARTLPRSFLQARTLSLRSATRLPRTCS